MMPRSTPKGDRWFRAQGPGLAVAILVSVLIGGTIGYHLIEGWSIWRSFYVTALAVTTVELPSMSPYQIGAIQIAQTALRPAAVDFVELATSTENLDLAMEQVAISSSSRLASQTIFDANLRQRFGVIVVGIQRQDRRMEFNPEPETPILVGDKLVVLGHPDSLKRLEAEATR